MYLAVGEGWKPIAEKVVATLEAGGVRILQVKEKYGHLTVYFDTSRSPNPEAEYWADDIVDQAATECSKICEECGKPGSIRQIRDWWKVVCDEHYI